MSNRRERREKAACFRAKELSRAIAIDNAILDDYNGNWLEADVKSRLDRFGRVVIPKDVRERLGLRTGTEVEIEMKGNEIVLKPVEHEPSLMVKEGILVYSGKSTGDIKAAVRGACARFRGLPGQNRNQTNW